MKALLLRFADAPDGVFGWLYLYDEAGQLVARFATSEEDWLDNAPSISCIPAATYQCTKTVWHKFDIPTYEIRGVPHRERILIHTGNTEEDSKGCVLVGTGFGAVPIKDEDLPGRPQRDKWAVVNSREAFKKLMTLLAGVQEFVLEIRWGQPGEWRTR